MKRNTTIKNPTHRPKGSMCMNCRFLREYAHCDDLSFTKMKPVGRDDDGVIVVICNAYERIDKG